jgi:hypothetical protein
VTPDFDQLAAASQCEVFDAGMGDGSPLVGLAVLTLRGRPLLAQLRGLLHVRASAGFECMCPGDCTLRFRDDAGLALATVSLHHAASLRWDGWEGDRELVDGPGLVEWLAERGYARPLQYLRASRARAAEAAVAERAWSQAAPAPVRHLLPSMLATAQSGTVPADLLDELRRVLATGWPDEREQCRALLVWYGAGTRRYSGYPVHEDIPGILLAGMPVTVVVDVLQQDRNDQGAWAGAVRHLASREARTAKELRAIPGPVRDQLLTVAEGRDEAHARRLRASWRPRR